MNREELELLSKFKEQICRDNCEKDNMCNDCYIEFEEVKAVEKLLNNYNNLINYLEDRYNFLQNIENHTQVSIGRRDEIKDLLERVKSGNYE